MGFHRHRVEKAVQILGENDKQVGTELYDLEYLNQAITCGESPDATY